MHDIKKSTIVVLHWPIIAKDLEITPIECQKFLTYFSDMAFSTFQPDDKPHGSIFRIPSIVHHVRNSNEEMEIPIQLIYDYLISQLGEDVEYVWIWNWNDLPDTVSK